MENPVVIYARGQILPLSFITVILGEQFNHTISGMCEFLIYKIVHIPLLL